LVGEGDPGARDARDRQFWAMVAAMCRPSERPDLVLVPLAAFVWIVGAPLLAGAVAKALGAAWTIALLVTVIALLITVAGAVTVALATALAAYARRGTKPAPPITGAPGELVAD
jgi:hypothetical protein